MENLHSLKSLEVAPGFSGRLSYLCDLCGIPKRAGRYKKVAEIAEVSLKSSSNWLEAGIVPRFKKLHFLVSKLSTRLHVDVAVEEICHWLLTGENNPFGEDVAFITSGKLDHAEYSRIYVEVHHSAKSLNIDIHRDMDEQTINRLFNKLIQLAIREKDRGRKGYTETEDFRDLTKSILMVAKKNLL